MSNRARKWSQATKVISRALQTLFKVAGLIVLIPILVLLFSPLLTLFLVGFSGSLVTSSVSGTPLFEPLIVGVGLALATASTCFGYSRASEEGSPAKEVGYAAGRFLLVASVFLSIGLMAEFVRFELYETRSPEPVAEAVVFGALANSVTVAFGGGALTIALAVLRLYWHALRLYADFIRK